MTGVTLTLQISMRAWVGMFFCNDHLVETFLVFGSTGEEQASGLGSMTEQRLGS